MNIRENLNYNDIICAISTAPGMGAIAVVRLSGKGSIALTDSIFESPNNKKLANQKPYTVHFGKIMDNQTTLDEVLITIFHAPHSFTGEESVEIACHGSLYIQQKLMEVLIHKGARLAEAGEYTRRAFANGKFDLSQAEAVADLIAATSASSHKVSLNQMRGGFTNKIAKLRDTLLQFVSLIELELDFSEEDVEFANRETLTELTNEVESEIDKLANSFSLGNVIKNGVPVAIIGETNAGKSTLLNLLLEEEKAIVSDIHGTTRDVIEDVINIEGISFRFIDTAGIRNTSDEIEMMGIERTYKKIEQASIVLWVIDLTTPDTKIEDLARAIVPKLKNKHSLLLFNKADLLSKEELENKQSLLEELDTDRLFISAKNQDNIHTLQELLIKAAHVPSIGEADVIVTNMRHYQALVKAHVAIKRVSEGLEMGISHDFLAQDIRECMFHLGEISGHISTDEILGNIFSKFCIGK
ncbi:MAG TPA: tRNA uridine-5-carboxymethylaminomethyl(34) synthesis GTPase MnmE [Dysgonamonadaceae bacterium]|nr:tRNA uridine-5-carboxymethylaminomethyl(34) synthesis GTPase MnmE [Dysgonamonadaceae bacterium]